MRCANKTFLVTGGASGLGGATAKRLAGVGARILIADLNEAAGVALAAEIGNESRFLKVDVGSEADVQRAVDIAANEMGGLFGAINCAGVATAEKVLNRENVALPLSNFSRVININLVGTFNVIRLAAQAMSQNEPDEEGERGVIINTASVAAYDGQIGQPAYAASKAGVVGLTLPIARELARFGIRVVTIAPGLFETPMMAGLPPAAQQALGASVPFPPRLGRPHEYAALAEHIIENTMINGETIRLDGALRMAPK
jgi:NAD(P)-dependent dehydrogenase (short-subunit alcohol dehydrogenase family)